MAMDMKELYWAAGFMEGEGSFVTSKSPERHSFTITACQVQKEPLERLQVLFGGSMCLRNARNERSNPCWVWKAFGSRAAGAMMTLFPLMSSKRKSQIKNALGMWRIMRVPFKDRPTCARGHVFDIVSKKGWRYCSQCRKLNRQKQVV